MAMANMPEAEVEIDVALVRMLLQLQHPDLSDLPLRPLSQGWDNAMFRLGDDLLVRLPRRQLGAALVENEQRWLPTLASRLPIAIPVPVRRGVAAEIYPWSWSVVPFHDGVTAAECAFDGAAVARDLAEFLRALHFPSPPDAPHNRYRGVPLRDRHDDVVRWIAGLGAGAGLDAPAAMRCRERAVDVPYWGNAPVWIHGDLHPANLITRDGNIVAVVDFGDIAGGDPATDLASAWMLFDGTLRSTFRAAYGNDDDDLWARARGWALMHSTACLANSADNPRIHRIAEITMAAVLNDATS